MGEIMQSLVNDIALGDNDCGLEHKFVYSALRVPVNVDPLISGDRLAIIIGEKPGQTARLPGFLN